MPIRERFCYGPIDAARVGRMNRGINSTFIVYRWDDTVIDAGPPNQWREVKSYLSEKPVRQLVLTHHHEDHAGNAARIADLYGLTPMAPIEARDKLENGYRVPIMQRFIWGAPIPVKTAPLPAKIQVKSGDHLVPLFTPGHAKDLHVLHVPEKGWLFSGDLYIARAIRYLRSDEDLPLLMDSIRKALTLDFDTIFCPHRGLVEDGKSKLREKLQNMVTLCERSQELRKQGKTLDEIVHKILGPEDAMAKLTSFNFSKRNLIKGALEVTDMSA
ncbi:MBL fold metallo-hydrolase [Sneathiella sp. P13V-1]|uniref:MBL fold metallo-hydrolase n=1 Tax=Sneathiella sp. P13V-1 TaxID=2697366 RepID=UPI00187B740C|nr:MBL fold metallo-hydrolase [Sneathiella sp. P13V-1]MBE7636219.1 MBL fold metallo-hydrolase [Sneathiella sp. P13V-1]